MRYLLLLMIPLSLACTPPALVLQRESQTYYRRAQAAEMRRLTEAERQRLGLCLDSLRRTERLAHAGYPMLTGEAKEAAEAMRGDCAAVDTWGKPALPDRALPAPDDMGHRDLKPDSGMGG